MKLAINLASNQKGLTGINPPVGCVIVKNDKIISYGVTDINGRPHAETIALNKNNKNTIGSTVYLTLEPCSHYGKTPPCTKALIKSKVKKVIYSIKDSDRRSFNKAKKILRAKKILTQSGLLVNQANKLYKSYNFNKKKNQPYVVGKLACSSNFYILKNKKSITNEYSKETSHILRFQNIGLLTSYKTINSDNPRLTCRINGLEKFSPTRIIIDRNLKINLKSFILKDFFKHKTIIFHNSNNFPKINTLKKKGIKLVSFEFNNKNFFDMKKVLKKIYSIGISTLLVESGKILTKQILSKNLFNEFYLFKSNKKLNNRSKIKVSNIIDELNKKFKNKDLINTYLDKDTLMHYY